MNLRDDISFWTTQGKLPILGPQVYCNQASEVDESVEEIVSELSDIKSDIKNISKILLQAHDYIDYNRILILETDKWKHISFDKSFI